MTKLTYNPVKKYNKILNCVYYEQKTIISQLHQMPPTLYLQSLIRQSTSVTQMICRNPFEVTRIKCLINYRGLNKHKKIKPTYPNDTNCQSHQNLGTHYHY